MALLLYCKKTSLQLNSDDRRTVAIWSVAQQKVDAGREESAAHTHTHACEILVRAPVRKKKKKDSHVAACALLIAADAPSSSSECLLPITRVQKVTAQHAVYSCQHHTWRTTSAETEEFVRRPRVPQGSHRKVLGPKIFTFVLILDLTLWHCSAPISIEENNSQQ